jgi:hypothetical protein
VKLFWQCLAAVLAGIACAIALMLIFPPKARPAARWCVSTVARSPRTSPSR